MSAIEIPGYKIIKTLGVGGQATVYLAIQKGFDREVALKVMSPALAADPSFGERFIREAKIVAKLSHARIVTVYDVGESGSFYYLAMEYMRGDELKTRIAKGVNTKVALTIVAKVAKALHFAHEKGYIHRDVKSENILFDEDEQPVLADFGIAKASNSSTQMTQTGKLIGTPEYMSPEQCRGRQLDGRADLYSLGIILFELLTKTVPFTGEDSVSICIKHVTQPVPQLPSRLKGYQWLIDSLLAKNPDDRFQTGEELSKVIRTFLTEGKIPVLSKNINTKNSGSRTVISEVISQDAVRNDFDDELFEFDDDHFDGGQRINVRPEKQSKVVKLTASVLLIFVVAIGYQLKDNWLPQAKQILNMNTTSNETEKSKQNRNKKTANLSLISDEKMIRSAQKETQYSNVKGNKEPVEENKKTSNSITPLESNVEQLIKQTKTLSEHVPHELTDIQQALAHLITVKSLEPSNQKMANLKKQLIDISLNEAILSAENNMYSSAFQWLKLVEDTEHDNKMLASTKVHITFLEKKYREEQQNTEEKAEQLEKFIIKANERLKALKLSSPAKNNALYFFEKASLISPRDERIRLGMKAIETKYVDLTKQAINAEQFSKASSYIEKIKRLPNMTFSIKALQNKLVKEKSKYDLKKKEKLRQQQIVFEKNRLIKLRQEKLQDPLVQMKLGSILGAAKDLIERGNLVSPIGNNALEKYNAALKIDSLDNSALEGIKNIEKIIILNVETAVSNKLKNTAEEWLVQLRLFNSAHAKVIHYQSKIEKLSNESLLTKNKVEKIVGDNVGTNNEIKEKISESEPEPEIINDDL